MRFSQFRGALTQDLSSVRESKIESMSSCSYLPIYNPRLFKRIGGIKVLVKIFELFFAAAVKDERLSGLYGIKAEDTVPVENLRRKYAYMLASMMGSHCAWQGENLSQIHQGTRQLQKFNPFKIPGHLTKKRKKPK